MYQVNELIKQIGEFDSGVLLEEYNKIESRLEWLENKYQGAQCSLQTKRPGNQIDGTGNLGPNVDIKDFNILNEVIVDSVWSNFITQYSMYRTRLMWVNPRSCYRVHWDTTPRIHFVVKTNPDARFYFPDLEGDKMVYLEEGKIYWVDTTKNHSFINFGDTRRLHLVGAVDKDLIF